MKHSPKPANTWPLRGFAALVQLALFLSACSTPSPPYVCVPGITSTGQHVLLCQPFLGRVQ